MRRAKTIMMSLLAIQLSTAILGQTGGRPGVTGGRKRLGFVNAPATNAIIASEVALRVGEDRMMRPTWVKVAIRIPDIGDIPCESLPFDYIWDTRKGTDGEKIVEIVMIDTHTGSVTTVDTVDLWVRNRGRRAQRAARPPISSDPGIEPQQVPDVNPPERIVITLRGKPGQATPPPAGSNRKGSLPPLPGVGPAASAPAAVTGDDPAQSTNGANAGDTPPANPDEVRATYGKHRWAIRCGILFHEDTLAQTTDAFLPWNDRAAVPTGVTANAEGATVETTSGTRTICLVRPADAKKGFDGFVRVRLGTSVDHGRSETAKKLGSVISSWQGVPYLWGGSSRTGTDCSGFVMAAYRALGVNLPHGSMYLRTFRSDRPSTVVHDELRYGDVLVYPGHCAIYTGDGTTAETVGGQVGRRTIWIRDNVVVRRFLESTPEKPWERSLYASRGGRRGGSR